MKFRLVASALTVIAALAFMPSAWGQTVSAVVVSSCGTPPTTYVAGQPYPVTQDTTGKACASSSSTVSGTVTANQGTQNAGTTASWWVQLYNGIFGPTAVGSAAANPPVQIGGTATGTSTSNVVQATVKAASTAPAATDTAVVDTLRDALPAGQNIIGGVGASKHLVSSTLTKISGAGTYTGATSAAPQAICLYASVTACAPMTMTVSTTNTVTGNLTGVMLVKSTTGATAATFRVYVFKSAPTLTGVYNTTTYLVPLADITSPALIGTWDCTNQIVNTDNSRYDCVSNQPSGNNAFNLTDGTLQFVIAATGAYVSGSSETFNVMADTLQSVP